MRKLADQEAAAPAAADAQAALGDAWAAAAAKERTETMKARSFARALSWYETALGSLKGAEKARVEKRIDDCIRQSKLETRIVFVPEDSMKLFPIGQKFGTFPEQKIDDPLGPFRGEPVYFSQKTGTDVVYQVRSGRKLRRLSWKGSAMMEMTIEVLDAAGTVVSKGGPWGGGNVWAEFSLDFPPSSRFTLRLRNHVSVWYLVDTLKLE